MKYVKKPIPVEAFCPKDTELINWPDWFTNNKYSTIECKDGVVSIFIDTLEGVMKCSLDDYIVQGVDGELYPCRRDIFLKTYEKFEEGN